MQIQVGPGGDAEGSFEIIDAIGQLPETQASSIIGKSYYIIFF